MRIGVDIMGSDRSPKELFEAVKLTAGEVDSLIVFSTEEIPDHPENISFFIVPEVITMDDDPLSAIRLKRESSLVAGVRQLAEGKIDAFVSAGNTGALVASATLTLPLLSGVERPALIATLPTIEGSLAMVDVGGTISHKAERLVEYAKMGVVYQMCQKGIEEPTVGLLNIGVESKKGTSEIRKAYQALEEDPSIRFVGNVEGREVFRGKVDVLVTDGFTGNVMLKTTEGASSFVFEYLKKHAPEGLHSVLEELQSHFHYDAYPGALIGGVDGIIIKCHGEASAKGMANSIRAAKTLLENQLLEKIKRQNSSNTN